MTGKIAACLVLAGGLSIAGPVNLSGVWRLDVQKSGWGRKKPAVSGSVSIQHQEPKLKYAGEISTGIERSTSFEFDGAIDGKPYTVKEDNYTRSTVLKRKNDRVIESTVTSQDGKSVEHAITTVSRDGKTLTRRVRLKAPEGEASWTEVYVRQ